MIETNVCFISMTLEIPHAANIFALKIRLFVVVDSFELFGLQHIVTIAFQKACVRVLEKDYHIYYTRDAKTKYSSLLLPIYSAMSHFVRQSVINVLRVYQKHIFRYLYPLPSENCHPSGNLFLPPQPTIFYSLIYTSYGRSTFNFST